MTKVALKGPVNGTGTYTLRAPETANTLELELPLAGTHLAGAQADGMPLGPGGDPVVESGSNSDGEWVRFADRTQLCRKASGAFNGNGTLQSWEWTFPMAFISGPNINSQWRIVAGYFSGGSFQGLSANSVGFKFNPGSGVDGAIHASAVGVWK